jgi:hypothetical protein
MGNGLELPVFIDFETVLRQPREMFTRNGIYTDIQQDELGGHTELEWRLGYLSGRDLRRECLYGDRQPEDEDVS